MYGLTTQYIGKTYQMFQLSATGPKGKGKGKGEFV